MASCRGGFISGMQIISTFLRTTLLRISIALPLLASTLSCSSAYTFPKNPTTSNAKSRYFIQPRRITSLRISATKAGFDYTFLIKDKPSLPKEELLPGADIDRITALVNKRAEARAKGDYDSADDLRKEIDDLFEDDEKGTDEEISAMISLPAGYKIEIKDIPRKNGGGSDWTLKPVIFETENMEEKDDSGMTVLGLAHIALGLTSSSSERNVPIDNEKLNDIILQAKKRLLQTGEKELRGRRAADAAFWFALAGVSGDQFIGVDESSALDFSLFDALTFICFKELSRSGDRPSTRPIDIMHIVERIAAAGVRSDIFVGLQHEAARCLELKDTKDTHDLIQRGVVETLRNGKFELHSERPLLLIWKFSTKQRKQRAFLKSAANHWDNENQTDNDDDNDTKNSFSPAGDFNLVWDEIFKDPTRPLIVDIGCGMGVSNLGLSTMDIDVSQVSNAVVEINKDQCNFLGADLSRIGINFASSLAKRWNLSENVHFVVASAEEILENVANSYPGDVELCMLQFPTPFQFIDKIAEKEHHETIDTSSAKRLGNMQLPSDAFSGFMVTKRLLDLSHTALNKGKGGNLLLQSNCEDVAVFMKKLACDSGFEPMSSPKPVTKVSDSNEGVPQRTQKWIELGGERAEGNIWHADTVLPSKRGATETEVACLLNRTPVHRLLLKPSI